jgi:hypothetical protein
MRVGCDPGPALQSDVDSFFRSRNSHEFPWGNHPLDVNGQMAVTNAERIPGEELSVIETGTRSAQCASASVGVAEGSGYHRLRGFRLRERHCGASVERMVAARSYANGRWLEYTGLSEEKAMGWGWKVVLYLRR